MLPKVPRAVGTVISPPLRHRDNTRLCRFGIGGRSCRKAARPRKFLSVLMIGLHRSSPDIRTPFCRLSSHAGNEAYAARSIWNFRRPKRVLFSSH